MTETTTDQDIYYIIDSDDIVVDSNVAFSNFAAENNANGLEETVLGKPIWDFLSCDSVLSLYYRLFNAVRDSQRMASLHFRCDSHDVIRFMRMDIAPFPSTTLKVTTRQIREINRKIALSREIFYLGINQGVPMCSHCNKVYIYDVDFWLEIDQALELNHISRDLSVDFQICQECEEGIEDAIAELD